MKRKEDIIVIGHRGSRGLKPENTIPAFLEAIKLGAEGLEMDLFITKDGKVVVTHDASISAELCLTPEGQPVDKEKSERLKVYELNFEDIKPFDCGSEPNPDFPEQQSLKTHIPSLEEVTGIIENRSNNGQLVQYFLEFKSDPATDFVNHPHPEAFAKKVVETIKQVGIQERAILMSFDKRCLQETRKITPEIRIGLAIDKKEKLEKEIKDLGFVPDAIFPQFKEVDNELIGFVQQMKMEIFPWTVNEVRDIEQILGYKINGLITDYPDRAIKIVKGE